MAVVTTNYIIDPNAVTFTAGHYSGLGSVTVGQVASPTFQGGEAAECITAGGAADQGVRFFTATSLGITGAARTFVGTGYVRGSGNLYIQTTVVYTDTSFVQGTATNFTATGTYTRYTAGTLTLNPAKTVDFIVVDVRTQSNQTVTFYTDCVMLEEGTVATAFFDGSTASGSGTTYAWLGGTNASASTRTVTSNTTLRRIRSQFQLRPY